MISRSPENWPPATRRAFGLIELVAVLGLIALLAGIVLGAARHSVDAGHTARARADLNALCLGLEEYRRNFGDYPQTDQPAQLLQALLGRLDPRGAAVAAPPAIAVSGFVTLAGADPFADTAAMLSDPWGHPYVYIYKVPPDTWASPSFLLYSCGPDGIDTRPANGFSDLSLPGNADNLYAGEN